MTYKKMLRKVKDKLQKVKFLQVPYSKIKIYLIGKSLNRNLHRHGISVLSDVVNALNDTDWLYFCALGTMLGIVRDNDFIAYDEDMDMGIVESDDFSWAELQRILEAAGMKITRQFEANGVITEQTYEKNKVRVDFFLYQKEDLHLVRYRYFWDQGVKYPTRNDCSVAKLPYPPVNRTERKDFSGISVPIPENYEQCLVSDYGENWQIPISDYKRNFKSEEGIKGYRKDFE